MNPIRHPMKAAALALVLGMGVTACSPASEAPAPAAATPDPAAVAAEAAAKAEADKAAKIQVVKDFYDAAINQKDFDKASTFLGATYIQHNPGAQDGPEGLKGFLGFLKTSFPASHSEIKHAYADGNFVVLHVHSLREPNTLGRAIVDIFRLDENNKIVEHWDVVQDIPKEPKNTNTMF
jgi:predicted SnoaL-like aldol condensation-catalyzing enzyme